VKPHHGNHDGYHLEDPAQQLDQTVAQHLIENVNIVGQPTHHVSGVVPVKVAQAQRLDLGENLLADLGQDFLADSAEAAGGPMIEPNSTNTRATITS